MTTIPDSVRDSSALFSGMTESEIESCLTCSGAKVISYQKDELVFHQADVPSELLLLVDGDIVIGNDSPDGRRNIMNTISTPGELFGEVFLFIGNREYDYYAQARTDARVLHMPRNFLYHTCGEGCSHHSKLISNMMSILAGKAYALNRRLQVLSCSTLRAKIAKTLLLNSGKNGRLDLNMNREELAGYLNTTRPSLSRELMKMQDEGLIDAGRKTIVIKDRQSLSDLI
ncbi:MAG: Crp/Fnr family transcriptional regulator [Anaerovoracaceae bacterium]|jgi:CRP-like cAMP-binding protein